MIETIARWIFGERPGQMVGGVARSSAWPKMRKDYLQRWSWCAACGRKNQLEVHHIVPFWKDRSQELSLENLITLCRPTCHLLIGHLNSWSSYNVNVRQDAELLLSRIKSRPE